MFDREEKGCVQNYQSDRSCENQRNVKNVEKLLKYELRRCEVEAMDKIAEDLADTARQHNSKILYWHASKSRGTSQSGLFPVRDRNGATISAKEIVKERWVEHFENVLNGTRAKSSYGTYDEVGRAKSQELIWHEL